MTKVTGKIAEYASGEIPEDWAALEASPNFGPSRLDRRLHSVMTSMFGRVLSTEEQDALDERVAEYAGKQLALSLINPAISYWSKQVVSAGATGRNETKAWSNRAAGLREIREALLADTRRMWPEVEVLLPDRRTKRVANHPRVIQAGTTVPHKTPSPDDFEEAYGSA